MILYRKQREEKIETIERKKTYLRTKNDPVFNRDRSSNGGSKRGSIQWITYQIKVHVTRNVPSLKCILTDITPLPLGTFSEVLTVFYPLPYHMMKLALA